MAGIIRKGLFTYLKGILMGSADIVPGVSGGTMALIAGIYPRLIKGISDVFSLLGKENLTDLFKGRWKESWNRFLALDFALFIPLLLGIASAFLLLSNVIHIMIENHTIPTYSFFMGLILASAFFLYKQLDRMRLRTLGMIALGFICSFMIVGIDTLRVSNSLPIIFFSGSIAITAMILPGISGAFILVMLNQYEFMLNVLRTFDIGRIAVFIAGALFGLALFSRLIGFLLRRYRYRTMGFLIGLMLGSMRLQYSLLAESSWDARVMIISAVAAICGFGLVYAITKLSYSEEYPQQASE